MKYIQADDCGRGFHVSVAQSPQSSMTVLWLKRQELPRQMFSTHRRCMNVSYFVCVSLSLSCIYCHPWWVNTHTHTHIFPTLILGSRSEGTTTPGATVTPTGRTRAKEQLQWFWTKRLRGSSVPQPVAAELGLNPRGLAATSGPAAQTTTERAAGWALGRPRSPTTQFAQTWSPF